jgi:hypothetical protein
LRSFKVDVRTESTKLISQSKSRLSISNWCRRYNTLCVTVGEELCYTHTHSASFVKFLLNEVNASVLSESVLFEQRWLRSVGRDSAAFQRCVQGARLLIEVCARETSVLSGISTISIPVTFLIPRLLHRECTILSAFNVPLKRRYYHFAYPIVIRRRK